MSPTTPTTVVQGSLGFWKLNLNLLPTESSLAQKRRAMVALMMATRGELGPSCAVNHQAGAAEQHDGQSDFRYHEQGSSTNNGRNVRKPAPCVLEGLLRVSVAHT